MPYSAKILQNLQRRKCWEGITENSRNVVRSHRGVITSVVIRSVDQLSAPLEVFIKTHCFAEKPSSGPFLPLLFRPLVWLREEQNFISPGMCRISNFVTKRWSANHPWRPSSKAARKKCCQTLFLISWSWRDVQTKATVLTVLVWR